jgi:hypothetical protein
MKLGRAATLASAVGVLGVAFGSVSCTGRSIDNSAQVRLVITGVRAEAGSGTGGGDGSFLLSDVTPVFNDNAILSVSAVPVNPTLTDTDKIALGTYDNVLLERYEVHFVRTDGHNVEGVDVPFGFSGSLATTVPFNGSASVAFVVVRHQSKDEPPLRQLRSIGGALRSGGLGRLHVIANIAIHGRTLSGDVVSAETSLDIFFSDYS